MRKPIVTVTIKDCKVQTFTVSGHGGAGKDTSNTGVRITHPPSGATGIGQDTRSQSHNKRDAFMRMVRSSKFQLWLKQEHQRRLTGRSIEEVVDEMMEPENLRIEYLGEEGD